MFACIITPWPSFDGAPMGPRFQSVGPFVISFVPCSAIMPISLPNAPRMHSCRMRPPWCPRPRDILAATWSGSLSLSPFLLFFLSSLPSKLRRKPSFPPLPHRAVRPLSRRFLRIDVIGLFALFRLCASSLLSHSPCNARPRWIVSRSGSAAGLGATLSAPSFEAEYEN